MIKLRPVSKEVAPHRPADATHVWEGMYFKKIRTKIFRWSVVGGWTLSAVDSGNLKDLRRERWV